MTETNFKRFLMIIKSAGFVDSALLPAKGPLNFAYALFLKMRSEGHSGDEIEKFIRPWFVLSLLTGRYSGSLETRFDQDIQQIDQNGFGKYLKRIEEAELSDVFWNVGLVQALTTSNSNHPAFKTFLAAQAKNNVRGFLSKDITVRSLLEHRGDKHHIFPRDHLKNDLKLTQAQYNQVANYAYTQQEINISIGKVPPQLYMHDVRTQCISKQPVYGGITDIDDLRLNLSENAIPETLLDDGLDYVGFLEERRQLMASKIRRYYNTL